MHEPVELKSLVYDNTSGAREIAQRSLLLLQKTAMSSANVTPAALLDELAEVSMRVLRSKPEMAPVFQALNRFLLDAEAEEAQASDVDHIGSLKEALRQTAGHAQGLMKNGGVILTHSRSSSVLEALKLAKTRGQLFDVIVTESRPMLEGRTLARELAEDQIPVRFVVDALAATAVRGCDRVLVGADAVTQTDFINKAGTHALALAAKDAGVPINLLADTGKAWVKKLDPNLGLLQGRTRDPKEVWDHPPLGIEVLNLYFDLTPLPLVESLACEHGIVSPTDFWGRVKNQGYARRLRDAFADELV